MRSWPGGFVLVAMSLASVPGCGEDVDHCVAYTETCCKWCEGTDLSACLNEGAALAQDQDQEACFDATMRLACDSFEDAAASTISEAIIEQECDSFEDAAASD